MISSKSSSSGTTFSAAFPATWQASRSAWNSSLDSFEPLFLSGCFILLRRWNCFCMSFYLGKTEKLSNPRIRKASFSFILLLFVGFSILYFLFGFLDFLGFLFWFYMRITLTYLYFFAFFVFDLILYYTVCCYYHTACGLASMKLEQFILLFSQFSFVNFSFYCFFGFLVLFVLYYLIT